MTINDILVFVKDDKGDFEVGKRLYLLFGTNKTRCKILEEQGAIAYTKKNIKKWLEEALEEIDKTPNFVPAEKNLSTPIYQKITPKVKEDIKPGELPDELEALKTNNGLMFKEMSRLHATLEHLPVNQRKETFERIKELQELIDENWSVIDAFKQTGRYVMPTPKGEKKRKQFEPIDITDFTPVQLIKYLNNLRAIRTKAKGNEAKWNAVNEEIIKVQNKINDAV